MIFNSNNLISVAVSPTLNDFGVKNCFVQVEMNGIVVNKDYNLTLIIDDCSNYDFNVAYPTINNVSYSTYDSQVIILID